MTVRCGELKLAMCGGGHNGHALGGDEHNGHAPGGDELCEHLSSVRCVAVFKTVALYT